MEIEKNSKRFAPVQNVNKLVSIKQSKEMLVLHYVDKLAAVVVTQKVKSGQITLSQFIILTFN